MADASILEQIAVALDRVEAAAARMNDDRERARRQAAAFESAGTHAVAALDALLATG